MILLRILSPNVMKLLSLLMTFLIAENVSVMRTSVFATLSSTVLPHHLHPPHPSIKDQLSYKNGHFSFSLCQVLTFDDLDIVVSFPTVGSALNNLVFVNTFFDPLVQLSGTYYSVSVWFEDFN